MKPYRPFLKQAATAALLTALLVPGAALASGSWAVPRFTPTWAELERDLRLLGLKSRPVARRKPAPKRPAVAAPTPDKPVLAEVKPVAPTSPGAETGAGGSTAGTSNAPGGTDPATGTTATGAVCKCEPAPPPRCPDVAPASGGAAGGIAAPAAGSDPEAKPDGPAEKPDKKGVKKKKGPADGKKLDRKKYWWQEN